MNVRCGIRLLLADKYVAVRAMTRQYLSCYSWINGFGYLPDEIGAVYEF